MWHGVGYLPHRPLMSSDPPSSRPRTKMRRFELEDASPKAFWEIWTEGPWVKIRSGRVGASARTMVSDEGTPEDAVRLEAELVADKRLRGYVERCTT